MTKEQWFLWLAESLMALALVCFVLGFRHRRSNLARHRRLGTWGAGIVFLALLVLEYLMRVRGWEFPVRSQHLLQWHIATASVALVTLVGLAITGFLRIRSVHVRLYVVFFPAYVATLVLSLFAFRLW